MSLGHYVDRTRKKLSLQELFMLIMCFACSSRHILSGYRAEREEFSYLLYVKLMKTCSSVYLFAAEMDVLLSAANK